MNMGMPRFGRANVYKGRHDDHQPGLGGAPPSLFRRCAVALLTVFVAFGIRYLLEPWLGDELPLMLFAASVLVSAAYGGAMAGMVALVAGLVLGICFFFSPDGVIGFPYSLNWVRAVRYVFVGVIGIGMIELLHRNQMRTRKAVADLRREVERRERTEAELREAKAEISQHAAQLERMVSERTAELQASLKSLEGMVYHIAHNLRAPLRAMGGFSMLLSEEYKDRLDDAGTGYLSRIEKGAATMDMLIADLLAFGRLGYMDIQLESTDLMRSVEIVLDHLGTQIKASGAEVEVAGPLSAVKASAQVLEGVLFNLLENALKFVSPGVKPRIRIAVEERGEMVRLIVRDNGIGVEPQYHERIFQMFERLHHDEYEGTGIGLAIVKEAMRRMGGEAGVESALGQGSSFWIELPRG